MQERELARDVAGLVRRIEDGWRSFQPAMAALPEARFEESIGGWTRKQMLAHVATWHEITAERLARFRATGEAPPPPGDDDTVNRGAAEAAATRDAADVVADVEATYHRVLEEVRSLRDEDVTRAESWAAAVVAGNTYEHYAEHRNDVA